MELIILGSIFGAVWLITTITFVVLYKKKNAGISTSGEYVDHIVKNQKEQSWYRFKILHNDNR